MEERCFDSERGEMQPVALISEEKRFPEPETGTSGKSFHCLVDIPHLSIKWRGQLRALSHKQAPTALVGSGALVHDTREIKKQIRFQTEEVIHQVALFWR